MPEAIVKVFDDAESLSRAAADFFVLAARDAIRDHSRFNVALAGGSTPKRLYDLLSIDPYGEFMEWDDVGIFFGDERFVPSTDASSNEGMAREALLSKVPIVRSNLFPMFAEGTPAEAATRYEKILEREAPNGLDLVLLGMGDDGHTLSLFPGIPELAETEKWVVPTVSPKGTPQRLTITIPYAAKSKSLLFMVAGADKAGPVAAALGAGTDLPSRMVSDAALAAGASVHWFLDKAAASELTAAQLSS